MEDAEAESVGERAGEERAVGRIGSGGVAREDGAERLGVARHDDVGRGDGFEPAADLARELGPLDGGVRAERLHERGDGAERVEIAAAGAVALELMEVLEDRVLRLLPEPVEFGDAARRRHLFEVVERGHAEAGPERAGLLRAEPFDAEHVEQARRQRLDELVERLERARRHERGDVGGDAFPDALHVGHLAALDELEDGLVHPVDGAGGAAVGAGAERVAPRQLDEVGGLFEAAGDAFVGHGDGGKAEGRGAVAPTRRRCRPLRDDAYRNPSRPRRGSARCVAAAFRRRASASSSRRSTRSSGSGRSWRRSRRSAAAASGSTSS